MRRLTLALALLAALAIPARQAGAPALGFAVMYPGYGQTASTPWQMFDPWGNVIANPTLGSQGLQDFLNAWAANRWDAECHGPAVYGWDATGDVFIHAPNGVSVPYVYGTSFRSTCGLRSDFPSGSTAKALTLDTQARPGFHWLGPIYCNPQSLDLSYPMHDSSSVCVEFFPQTVTTDGEAGQYYGEFEFGTIFVGGVTATSPTFGSWPVGMTVMGFNLRLGKLNNVKVRARFLDGGNIAQNGIAFYGDPAGVPGGTGMGGVTIEVQYIEGTLRAGIETCAFTQCPNPNAPINGNWTIVQDIEPSGGIGWHEFNAYNYWHVGVVPSNPATPYPVGPAGVYEATAHDDRTDCDWLQPSTGVIAHNPSTNNLFGQHCYAVNQ